MTDQEIKDSIVSLSAENRETTKILRETALIVKDTTKSIKLLEKQMSDVGKRIDDVGKRIDDVGQQVGGINDNIGHHAEQFFQDILGETLTFAGIKYNKMIPNLECKGKIPSGEFDIVLVNGKNVAIIEAKNRIHPNFVTKLVEEKVAKFRSFFPEYKNRKLYLGIAGFSFSNTVIEKAKKYGVGIIRQAGKSIEVEAQNLRAY
jgi:Holliday junction resolvase-like predicted endonuclease